MNHGAHSITSVFLLELMAGIDTIGCLQRAIDHSALLDWVWEYFTMEEDGKRASSVNLMDRLTGPVFMSGMSVLYL